MSACVSGLLEGLSYTSLDAFLRGTTMSAEILGLAQRRDWLWDMGDVPWVCFGTVPYVS